MYSVRCSALTSRRFHDFNAHASIYISFYIYREDGCSPSEEVKTNAYCEVADLRFLF